MLKKKEFVQAAAGVLAVEAYHIGMARLQLYMMGEKTWEAANAISDARDKIDGTPETEDQGIRVDGKADAITFHRMPPQVLHIVYLTDKTGVGKGGFYPNGMNGELSTCRLPPQLELARIQLKPCQPGRWLRATRPRAHREKRSRPCIGSKSWPRRHCAAGKCRT